MCYMLTDAPTEREPKETIDSDKETWNLKRGPLQTNVLFKGLLVRFHVNLGSVITADKIHKQGDQKQKMQASTCHFLMGT